MSKYKHQTAGTSPNLYVRFRILNTKERNDYASFVSPFVVAQPQWFCADSMASSAEVGWDLQATKKLGGF